MLGLCGSCWLPVLVDICTQSVASVADRTDVCGDGGASISGSPCAPPPAAAAVGHAFLVRLVFIDEPSSSDAEAGPGLTAAESALSAATAAASLVCVSGMDVLQPTAMVKTHQYNQ